MSGFYEKVLNFAALILKMQASLFFSASVIFCVINAEESKRLVLHSEIDIANEIISMKNQLEAQTLEIQDLKSKLNEKDTRIESLNNETSQMKAKINSLTNDASDMRNKLAKLESASGNSDSYTRWGRTVCPGNGSSLIYSGFMAGTYYPSGRAGTGRGSGASFLCLPSTPLWDYYSNSSDNNIKITGIEYNFSPFLDSATQIPFFGTYLGHSEAPCAVCMVTRGQSIIIPGRNKCYDGWTEEYSGYLVSGYPGYADSSEYVCLDRRPEVVPHSGNAENENQIFFVEGHCGGTLACPPYVEGRELACVVCST